MIRVDSLCRNYGEVKAVDRLSFEIDCGEIVGLLGHNGAGKTTIMKMLCGCLEPTRGYITIDGRDLATERTEVQKSIGYLPENAPLYPDMSVVDFLDYMASLRMVPKSIRRARIRQAVDYTALSGKENQ